MKIKAIIFDLDGVIVSTDKFHYQAWKQIADSLGIPFDEKMNYRLRGVSRRESLERILEGYSGTPLTEREKEKLAEQKNDIYRKMLQQMTPEDVAPEVRETLRILRERGYRTALGSSSKNAKFILEKTELTNAFDAVSDGTNITKSKPDPEVFLKAAEFLKEQPEYCLVVEDAKAGIEAANAAGMKAVAVGAAVVSEMVPYKMESIAELLQILP